MINLFDPLQMLIQMYKLYIDVNEYIFWIQKQLNKFC